MIRKQLRPAIVMTLVLCVITGSSIPASSPVLAQVLFPRQANGSLVDGERHGRRQRADRPAVHAAGVLPSASVGGGQRLRCHRVVGHEQGPDGRKLADTLIAQAVDSVVANDGAVQGQIPSDMVTSSASGLDPHISPANAQLQVARVARARGADAGARARARRRARRRPAVRLLRRAARQRAAAQPRARLGVPRSGRTAALTNRRRPRAARRVATACRHGIGHGV